MIGEVDDVEQIESMTLHDSPKKNFRLQPNHIRHAYVLIFLQLAPKLFRIHIHNKKYQCIAIDLWTIAKGKEASLWIHTGRVPGIIVVVPTHMQPIVIHNIPFYLLYTDLGKYHLPTRTRYELF